MTLRDCERNLQQRREFKELLKHYPFTTETLAGEEWKDIEGTDGKYQISNYARVKSSKYKQPRILKPYLNEDCYLAVELKIQGKRKFPKIHILVAKAFIPNPDNKPQINHIDGIKWNACVTNLEWVTQSENMRHAHDNKLIVMPKGEDVHNAKFTNEQILYIRNNPDNLAQGQLAKKFNAPQGTISCIQLGKTYSDVGGRIHTKFEWQHRKLSPEMHEEIYRLYQTGEYTHKQLAEMFGTAKSGIYHIIHQLDKKIGRKINYQLKIHEPSIREQIRTEYVKGSKEFGAVALAKKYSVSKNIILDIIHEGVEDYKPKEKPPRVPDALREQIRIEYVADSKDFNARALARKYGVNQKTILNILHEGGITTATPPLIPADIQEKIRTEYIKGSIAFGSVALARKYNCSYKTILRIIHEK